MPIAADYPFLEIFWTMVLFFAWIAWIWTLVMVLSDVFRADRSGWGKAAWTLFVVVVPFLGVLAYLIAHGNEMGERRAEDLSAAMGRSNGSGAASEIAEARRLLDSGAIDAAEYAQLKSKVLY
jgi:Phospholipase_D-nuclease N-terminal